MVGQMDVGGCFPHHLANLVRGNRHWNQNLLGGLRYLQDYDTQFWAGARGLPRNLGLCPWRLGFVRAVVDTGVPGPEVWGCLTAHLGLASHCHQFPLVPSLGLGFKFRFRVEFLKLWITNHVFVILANASRQVIRHRVMIQKVLDCSKRLSLSLSIAIQHPIDHSDEDAHEECKQGGTCMHNAKQWRSQM
jgi:hypothetical protein